MANDCMHSIAHHVSLVPAVGVKLGKANHLPRLHGDAASIFMGLASNSAVPHQLEQDQTSCLNNGMYAVLSFPVINAVLKRWATQCNGQRKLQSARIKDLNTSTVTTCLNTLRGCLSKRSGRHLILTTFNVAVSTSAFKASCASLARSDLTPTLKRKGTTGPSRRSGGPRGHSGSGHGSALPSWSGHFSSPWGSRCGSTSSGPEACPLSTATHASRLPSAGPHWQGAPPTCPAGS